jgi:predicted transposase/invertase (TIGR01784 family)
LHFIRYYVKFNEEESLQTLNKNIQTTFKHRKNMGIEEAILQAVREEAVEEGIHKGVLQTALRMKQAGVSTADIVKFTGLTKAQVEKLA